MLRWNVDSGGLQAQKTACGKARCIVLFFITFKTIFQSNNNYSMYFLKDTITNQVQQLSISNGKNNTLTTLEYIYN